MRNSSRIFTILALTTAVLTIGLIVVGAVVRVTDSGLGCGDSWPLCAGRLLPPLDNLTAWIEWSHRLFAALIGVLGLATLAVAWRTQRGRPLVFGAVALAAFLFFLQSSLGAIVVILELPPTMVALHLGTAMLLLAALLTAAVAARYQPHEQHAIDSTTWLIYITAALAFVIVLTGALVRGSGATLACADWPLCNGALLPLHQGHAALIHMLHRIAVLSLGVSLVLLVWQVSQSGRRKSMRQVALLALLAYGTQVGVGALFVLSAATPLLGAAHVGVAAITWAFLVILGVMEYLDNRELVDRAELRWKPQSETAAS